ncbi:MAG: hypothetical protein B2I17_00095 [Thermoplasmatales archaeon B_DKE]|nr:MAG: hypothetical protein B2I17_00095 [Thermoplasmatales archaeon B_DKE]
MISGHAFANENFEIIKLQTDGLYKKIKLNETGGSFRVPLSACVSEGDLIEISKNKVYTVCKNGLAQIFPYYVSKKNLERDGLEIDIIFKEITDADEFRSYQKLAASHYRNQRAFGRVSRLIARNFDPLYPKVIGYIELGTALYMNKARSRILNSPFSYNGISWQSWDTNALRANINLMVRITRCVVLPEFRGLGLGQKLVMSAIEFARDHWQIGGLKPYFLEISADMLKFVPFVEKSGMLFIGETEGNLERVWKDMGYLIKNSERVKEKEIVQRGKSGIVDQQISRMNRAIKLMEDNGLSFEDIIEKMKNLSKEKVLKDFDLFHQIISLPKPSYMMGLNESAQKFLMERIKEINVSRNKVAKGISIEPIEGPISINKVSVSFRSEVRRTRKTHAIQQAFGISPSHIETQIINDLSMSISPGEIILITGSSGSGKTTLLNMLSSKKEHSCTPIIQGDFFFPSNYRPSSLKGVHSKKALIELFKGKDVPSSLYLMGVVGLSDAFVYLKRFKELSEGQKYRFLLAYMLSSGANVWLLDEFCSNLDPMTAKAVAGGIQRIARKFGATVIAASPHYENFISSLNPDRVLRLTSAGEGTIIERDKFIELSGLKKRKIKVPSLKISQKYVDQIFRNQKVTTIREGRKNIRPGFMLFESKEQNLIVNVKSVKYKSLLNLDDFDAIKDGFVSKVELMEELERIYPNISERSTVTIIEFEPEIKIV